MQENENEVIEETTGAEIMEEMQAAAAEDAMEQEIQEEPQKKLFSLCFRIPLEDYLKFYEIMSSEDLPKNKRKAMLIGVSEIAVGGLFLAAALTQNVAGGVMTNIISAVIILMGFYNLLYYQLFYKKALEKNIRKEYDKSTYLKNDIIIGFYPTKCVEQVANGEVEHLWRKIHSVRVSDTLFLIMLAPKRCLLIPKKQIPEQVDAVDAMLREVCNNFEKPRYEI